MPFDLTTILGCSVRDARLRELSEFFEEQPRPTEPEPALGGRYYLVFPRSGFSLLLTGSDFVETVHIHTRSDDEYSAYTQELPLGASAHMTRAEARALLCPPSKSGGPVQFMSSSPVTYWDLWEFGDHSIHFEYPEDRLSISLVTLNVLPTD